MGTTVIHLGKPNNQLQMPYFKIVQGNDNNIFEVSNPSGMLVLIKMLDREEQDNYNLKISADTSGFSTINVLVTVDDSNDNAPLFEITGFEKPISENVPVNTSIEKFLAVDIDLSGTPNADVVYDITSGNDDGCFRVDPNSAILYVNETLDYDIGKTEYNLVLRACDQGVPPLCSLNKVIILLQDENDNVPMFPVMEYLEFVGENEPVGTVVFTAHATDLDKGYYGNLNYTVMSTNNYAQLDNSWKLFNIDPTSGLVTTATTFDYEQRNRYNFLIKATDVGGKFSVVKVRIEIEGKDEYHPQFTEKTYRLTLATSRSLPAGYIVGHVTATDRDKGPDGRVVYQLTNQHPFFKINRTTGDILIKRKVDGNELLALGREISLVITASSGRQGSLTNMTVVEIIFDPLADPGTNMAINSNDNTAVAAESGMADWVLGLLIALLLLIITFGAVLVFLHMKNKRNKKVTKPTFNSDTVSSSNNYVDPSAFDTIPVRANVSSMQVTNNQFAPPKYDEISPYGGAHTTSSNSGAATTSELSGSEQSGSSGRGSAEDGDDGEDEEIRMINEGPLQRDSGIHRQNDDDDDNLSDVSVRNTQQYLARLGIINSNQNHPQSSQRLDPRAGSSKESLHHHQSVPMSNLHIYDEEDPTEHDITSLIYAKINDVAGSERVNSSDDGGSVNPPALSSNMDHVMAMGAYAEVPTVATHQPSMNGSLSSIVHSEEELAGSYNWDYLLDWGPQYQPLAHVFSEIARLKDDTASVHSAASGTSSIKSKNSTIPPKNMPPPHISGVAPRSIVMPVLNPRGGGHHNAVVHNSAMMLPRSPINHDASGASFSTSAAMSPSFSPSLSPLATKSPSISPLVTPGLPSAHHAKPRQPTQNRNKNIVETELRI